jgi:hypothetical protein
METITPKLVHFALVGYCAIEAGTLIGGNPKFGDVASTGAVEVVMFSATSTYRNCGLASNGP